MVMNGTKKMEKEWNIIVDKIREGTKTIGDRLLISRTHGDSYSYQRGPIALNSSEQIKQITLSFDYSGNFLIFLVSADIFLMYSVCHDPYVRTL